MTIDALNVDTQIGAQAPDKYVTGLNVDEARAQVIANIGRIAGGRRHLPLRSALGSVLACSVCAPHAVPGHDNSAMDGFALKADDLPRSGEVDLPIVGASFAGGDAVRIEAGECARVMTGARIPEGADTVVMVEKVSVAGNLARFGAGSRRGDCIRRAGEDLQKGDLAVAAGVKLEAAHLGVIASLGIPEIEVTRQPRVAFFSTGDELKCAGERLTPGAIYDSNRYTLYGMIEQADAIPVDLGAVIDDRDQLREAMIGAEAEADLVLTSGGVSAGEADYVPGLLAELGHIAFWKIKQKPGHPLLFGAIKEVPFFGLPGNPVSVMASFLQYVRPAIQKLRGQDIEAPRRFAVTAVNDFKSRQGRTEFQRGVLSTGGDGLLQVASTGAQGSGVLTSMARANCFVILGEEISNVNAGEAVMVELL